MSAITLRAAYQRLDNRGPGFDMLRLVAASAVVVHHAMKIEHDIVRDDWLFGFSGGYTQLGLLAVSVFFALSGFLITPGLVKSNNVIGYLSRRFMRIMPLLVTVVVITALGVGPWYSGVSLADYYSSPVTWRYLKTTTTFLSLQLPGVTDYDGGETINGPIWTLHFEWMCYLVLAAMALLGVMKRRWVFFGLYVAAMATLFFVLGPVAVDGERGKLFMFLFLFGYFGAGVLIQLFSDRLLWSRALMLASVALLAGVYATPLDYLLAPLLTAYLVVGIGLLRFPETPLTTGVDLSYGVYLTHSVVLMALMNIYPFQSWLLLFAVCWPVSLLLAYGTWKWVEEPALKQKNLPEHIARAVIERIKPQLESKA
jgi:peptidoglycan/LPS O-acetylase OafA/YrhL